MRQPLIRCLFLLLAALALLAAPRPASADPGAFVSALGDEAVAALTGDLSQADREAKFRALLHSHFDLPTIGRFVLGRYWNVATDAERTEFMALFEDLIVQAYARRFSEYSGETFQVVNVRSDQEDYATVHSQVVRPSAEKIRVDWRIRRNGSDYKIIDVMVEGVSMAVTQRAEFASVIQSKGGKVAGLIEVLRQKTRREQSAAQ